MYPVNGQLVLLSVEPVLINNTADRHTCPEFREDLTTHFFGKFLEGLNIIQVAHPLEVSPQLVEAIKIVDIQAGIGANALMDGDKETITIQALAEVQP